VTGTLVTCDLDGKTQDSPLDDLDVLGMSALGYDDGWIYYMPFYQETEQLWRVRPDGSGQEMLTTWEGGGEMLSFAFGTDSCLGIVTGAGPVYAMDKDGGDRQQLWINK